MSAWIIYWILQLDVLVNVCIAGSVFSAIGIIGAAITFFYWKEKIPIYGREGTETEPSEYFIKIKKTVLEVSKKGLILFIILFCFAFPATVFLPTTKQACVIYLLPQIANNENMQKIPNNISDLMNKKLEQWIDDMRGKVKTETSGNAG